MAARQTQGASACSEKLQRTHMGSDPKEGCPHCGLPLRMTPELPPACFSHARVFPAPCPMTSWWLGIGHRGGDIHITEMGKHSESGLLPLLPTGKGLFLQGSPGLLGRRQVSCDHITPTDPLSSALGGGVAQAYQGGGPSVSCSSDHSPKSRVPHCFLTKTQARSILPISQSSKLKLLKVKGLAGVCVASLGQR